MANELHRAADIRKLLRNYQGLNRSQAEGAIPATINPTAKRPHTSHREAAAVTGSRHRRDRPPDRVAKIVDVSADRVRASASPLDLAPHTGNPSRPGFKLSSPDS